MQMIYGIPTKGNLENQEPQVRMGFQIKRKLYLNPMDIIVPASFDFSLERNIFVLDQIKARTILLSYKIIIYLFNNFGLFGSKNFFHGLNKMNYLALYNAK